MTALDVIYVKTTKGKDEILSRAHGLPARMRALLLMIDGSRPSADLIEKATRLGGGEEWLQEFLSQGFIRDSRNGGTPSAAAKQEVAPPVEGKPATAPAAAAAPPATPATLPADLPKRLSKAKGIMRYCVRNCTGFGDSRTLNKMLDQAHDKGALLDCLSAIAKKLNNGPQAAMVSEMRQQVVALLE